MPADPQVVQSAKAVGRSIVERLSPRDLAAVLFTRDHRHAQGFTGDRARLMKAIEAFSPGMHEPFNLLVGPGEALSERARARESVGVLHRLIDALGTIHDRRKAIIYVGIGLPLDPRHEVLLRAQEMLRPGGRANVNVFTVDPAGLGGLRTYVERVASRADSPTSSGRPATRSRGSSPPAATRC